MDSINNDKDPLINRGVELILRRRKPKQKAFKVCFEKMVFFLNREITIYFNFSLDLRKPK
jgi:hypothetical protein